ncbi:single-strand selective monofunctional uracil DNA glycosylase isoform X2 [Manduca sexta]|uniref:single-strand selective monofunctional uracil DNA glycosylase isoform X2 n=1 Tax=Manduca sexta TaxID=7130 RepID=UPI00189087B2|nr:single-strand selective monofunctional uracil DNA glycosylase isoform X2 [Manduca sexta]
MNDRHLGKKALHLAAPARYYVKAVPFGEISSVQDWLGIEGPVGKPQKELASRPVKGFNCPRTEQSGQRFWGYFKKNCGTPDKFFESSFVYNYLPQQWMKENGANLTPEDLKANEKEQLYSIIDPIFAEILELYDVKIIVAIGKFCEKRAQKTLAKYLPEKSIKIVYMPHPSPRSGGADKWYKQAQKCLEDNNLMQYYK